MVYTSTSRLFEEHTYPTTTSELVETYGEEQLQLANGSQTVADVLAPFGQETFESPEEARYAVYAGRPTTAGFASRRRSTTRRSPPATRTASSRCGSRSLAKPRPGGRSRSRADRLSTRTAYSKHPVFHTS
jgi:hypothetical protein